MKQLKLFFYAGKRFVSLGLINVAASLAYYALFSLVPVLLIILAAAQWIYDPVEVSNFLIAQLSAWFGQGAAAEIAQAVQALTVNRGSFIYTYISIGLLLVSATSVFSTLISAFNTIFELPVQESSMKIILQYLKRKLLSLLLIAGIAGLLLFSFFANVIIHALDVSIVERVTGMSFMSVTLLDLGLHLVVLTACFIFVFWLFIETRLPLRELVFSSMLTAVLLIAGRSLLGYYISSNETVTIYSSAGTLIVILMWTYYSSAIVLFGCAFLKESSDAGPVLSQ